ncbi:MAG: hypothetical protein R3C59_12130 [Planctomycetaceae bacterium]
MKRVLCLKLLNWPVQRQQRLLSAEQRLRVAIHTAMPTGRTNERSRHPADDDVSFVRQLFPSARSGPAIVCVSEDAWTAGVRPGMPLAEARSMAAPVTGRRTQAALSAETTFREWCPEDERRDLKAVAELIRCYAPIIGMDVAPVPDSLLLDITGCGALFGGEAALAEQLLKHLQTQGFRGQVAISDTVATAWAFAHAHGHFLQALSRQAMSCQRSGQVSAGDWNLPVIVIPPGQAEAWLHPLPIAAARIPLTDADVLFQLGILTLKQLLSLPFEDLPARLSAQAVQRLRQVRGIEEELIDAIPEANPVSALWVSDDPATNRGEVRQVLDHLIDDIVVQLKRRCVGAIRLTCRLKPESGQTIPLVGEVVKPVQCAAELSEVLGLKLDSLHLPHPIFSVRMRAVVAPLPVARQQDLFSPSAHIRPAEELAIVINRLSSRLGKQAVLTASLTDSPVPETSVNLTPVITGRRPMREIDDRLSELVTPHDASVWTQAAFDAPLRLFSEPVLLNSGTVNPLSGGFAYNGRQHIVADVVGPERLQTQWWQDTAVHRDYYRVRTQAGAEFWIYTDLVSGRWYLHGVFE